MEDVGDVELENGDRITLEKNSRYFLVSSEENEAFSSKKYCKKSA